MCGAKRCARLSGSKGGTSLTATSSHSRAADGPARAPADLGHTDKEMAMAQRPTTLTPAQQHILTRVAEGWALGEDLSVRGTGSCWLQQHGLGKGGAVEEVSARAVASLVQRGLLHPVARDFPVLRYGLTTSGARRAQ